MDGIPTVGYFQLAMNFVGRGHFGLYSGWSERQEGSLPLEAKTDLLSQAPYSPKKLWHHPLRLFSQIKTPSVHKCGWKEWSKDGGRLGNNCPEMVCLKWLAENSPVTEPKAEEVALSVGVPAQNDMVWSVILQMPLKAPELDWAHVPASNYEGDSTPATLAPLLSVKLG